MAKVSVQLYWLRMLLLNPTRWWMSYCYPYCSPEFISTKEKWGNVRTPRENSEILFPAVSNEGLGVSSEWITGHSCGDRKEYGNLGIVIKNSRNTWTSEGPVRWSEGSQGRALSFSPVNFSQLPSRENALLMLGTQNPTALSLWRNKWF